MNREILLLMLEDTRGGSQFFCPGNPEKLRSSQRQLIVIVDKLYGSQQVACPRRTTNGRCNIQMRPEIPEFMLARCKQPAFETREAEEIEIIELPFGKGFLRYEVQLRTLILPGLSEPISFTPNEGKIFVHLLRRPGEVIPSSELLPNYEPVTVRVHISHMKEKLGKNNQQLITSVRKEGFKLQIEETI